MRIIFWIVVSVVSAFVLSCQNNNEPNYSIVPHIENRDFKFIQGSIYYNKPDTMKLKFYLRDGDFDLGLNNTNDSAPFNSMFVLNKLTGQLIPVNGIPTDH
ncbi:MAG TPA: hypothetical protein VGQ59_14930, partial [Cyclobacteriaceae bacterium]|nr:hypothetical protein [Cyclobacteriaceae bacterium]